MKSKEIETHFGGRSKEPLVPDRVMDESEALSPSALNRAGGVGKTSLSP